MSMHTRYDWVAYIQAEQIRYANIEERIKALCPAVRSIERNYGGLYIHAAPVYQNPSADDKSSLHMDNVTRATIQAKTFIDPDKALAIYVKGSHSPSALNDVRDWLEERGVRAFSVDYSLNGNAVYGLIIDVDQADRLLPHFTRSHPNVKPLDGISFHR